MRLFIIVLALFLSSFSAAVYAQQSSTLQAKFLIDIGIHYGGDEIATIQFEDGDEQDMLAGQGLTLAVGGQFSVPSFKYALLRTSIGLKYSTTAADNANIMFLRYPFNVMAFAVPYDDVRVGIGFTSHLGAVLKGDGFFPDVDYDSSLAPRFEIGYKWAAITYNTVSFTDEFGNEFDGSSVGVTVSVTLPQ